MKKFIKISAIIIVCIFALLIILPLAFKGKIVEQLKIEINKNVDAKVDFDGFSLSFIRNFPDINMKMRNISVVNNKPFEGDTLANIKGLSLTVNLMSFISGDEYEIKKINLDNPNIHAKILEDGSANWDIAKESEEEIIEEEIEESAEFKLALKSFSLNNANIIYDDKDSDIFFKMLNSNVNLKGDFTESTTNIVVRKTNAEYMYLIVEEMPLLTGVSFDMAAEVAADLDNFSFTFLDNKFQFNDLILNFAGKVDMPESDIIMDITFDSPQTQFKSFLSLVPAIYAKDFEDIKTEGSLTFNGFAKGVMSEDLIPAFEFNLLVKEASFQYPELPASVTNINIAANAKNPGGDPDLSVINVNEFTMNMAGQPIDFKLNLSTPVSDPQIDAYLTGKIDLTKVNEFYPLEENEKLSGIIDTDIKAKGRLSSIENERYNEFLFDGKLIVTDMDYQSDDFPQGVKISKMDFAFSPRFVELKSLQSLISDSDFSATGRIDNLLGYFLDDQMLTGSFTSKSNFFNLNQFMSEEGVEQPKETLDAGEPVELSVIEIPGNIDFTLRSTFQKMIFDNMEMTEVKGTIIIADESATLQNLTMNMLDGNMTLNGYYSSKNINQPLIDFKLDIRQFDIQKTFNTFNTFATIAPIGERAHGKFSGNISLKSELDEKLNPVLNSIAGAGSISSNNVKITNSPALVDIAEQIKMDRFKELEVNDVSASFKIKEGHLEVQPFDVTFGNSTANISGSNSFDKSINYQIKFAIPRSEFGGAANEALDGLLDQAKASGLNITPGSTIFVGAKITGTVSEPEVKLDIAQSTSDIKDEIEDQIKDKAEEVQEQVQETIDIAKEQADAEREKLAQNVIDEAQKQADKIRSEAATSAKRIRDEARTNAKKLEDEASGPLAKAAARKTGEEMINTADKQAKKIENEADAKARQIMEEANKKAERIRSGKE